MLSAPRPGLSTTSETLDHSTTEGENIFWLTCFGLNSQCSVFTEDANSFQKKISFHVKTLLL